MVGFHHHGLKVFPDVLALRDKKVTFAYENDHLCDEEAIAIVYQGKKLGSVPMGLTRVLKDLREKYHLAAFIERIYGLAEKPSLLVFVEVRWLHDVPSNKEIDMHQ
jgi:hypothetical protein